jgi:hypothetical protein
LQGKKSPDRRFFGVLNAKRDKLLAATVNTSEAFPKLQFLGKLLTPEKIA